MRLNSFRDMIEDMFYNEIFNELSMYVARNPDKLESNSYYIESPDEATLSDFKVKWPSAKTEFGKILVDSYAGFDTDFIIRAALMLYGDVVKSNINKRLFSQKLLFLFMDEDR